MRQLLCASLAALALTSCFKDEPLNSEADIETAFLSVSNPTGFFFSPTDSVIQVSSTERAITFSVRPKTDLSALAPTFQLTAGATISPESGSVHDFTEQGVTYTVTSEDGSWTRTYTVNVKQVYRTYTDTVRYDFENKYIEHLSVASFYAWTDFDANGDSLLNWTSGNGGYAIVHSKDAPETYPSIPLADGYEGEGVQLITRHTGALGSMVGMPIAAGNLFLGKFEVQNALMDALSATRFGLPVDFKPVHFSGYYKYKPGEVYKDKKENVIEDKVDDCSIYAVLYRNFDADGNSVTLDGNNVLTSDLLVGTAVLENHPATDEWTRFDVDFTYTTEPDPDLIIDRGYNMAIVFSSSCNGDIFEGAVGSTLCVDNVEIIADQSL